MDKFIFAKNTRNLYKLAKLSLEEMTKNSFFSKQSTVKWKNRVLPTSENLLEIHKIICIIFYESFVVMENSTIQRTDFGRYFLEKILGEEQIFRYFKKSIKREEWICIHFAFLMMI